MVLNLAGVRCLILGDGPEANAKAAALAACGAFVERRAQWRPGLAEGVRIVVAALRDRSQNHEIFDECEQLGILLNCVDDSAHCRFTFASIVRRGELLIAVSTGGACPALSVRLRERLEAEFGAEYGEFLRLARGLRERLAEAVPDFEQRRAIWYALVDSDLLSLLREGQEEAANLRIKSVTGLDALP